jgi:hypothetical protein
MRSLYSMRDGSLVSALRVQLATSNFEEVPIVVEVSRVRVIWVIRTIIPASNFEEVPIIVFETFLVRDVLVITVRSLHVYADRVISYHV